MDRQSTARKNAHCGVEGGRNLLRTVHQEACLGPLNEAGVVKKKKKMQREQSRYFVRHTRSKKFECSPPVNGPSFQGRAVGGWQVHRCGRENQKNKSDLEVQ